MNEIKVGSIIIEIVGSKSDAYYERVIQNMNGNLVKIGWDAGQYGDWKKIDDIKVHAVIGEIKSFLFFNWRKYYDH